VRLSFVSTLYRSAPFVAEFCRRCATAAVALGVDYEIVLVNDGSPDDSLAVARRVQAADPRVTVVDLSRNFGHHKAIMTGLSYARGELIFLLDSDLEEEPELLPAFRAEMERTGADVVFGVQARRKGGFVERVGGQVYYWLFNAMSTHPVAPNLITARLMTRRYVDALLQHRERELCLSGVWAATGFDQVAFPVAKHAKGSTTYSFRKRLANLVDGITSFSNRPLILIFNLGMLIVLVAGTAALVMIVRRLFFGQLLEGWASLIVSIWLLGGLTIFCVGIVGVYLAKVFSEAKQRPYAIVRHVYRTGETEETD